MFVNVIGENPELMDDYASAVKFLNEIAKNYPEISVCYMANPYKPHQVVMNNGGESSDPNWHVDKRLRYIEMEKSEECLSVSAPYYDAQRGLYCFTFSEVVYGKNGIIINHPNNSYQLSMSRVINIDGTEYASTYYGESVTTVRDYTVRFMACIAKKNKVSDFTVVVTNSLWIIYGNVMLGFFILMPVICLLIVN